MHVKLADWTNQREEMATEFEVFLNNYTIKRRHDQTMNPVDIETRRQLLFDDALTQSSYGFEPTMNPAIRHNQPLLLPEKPWERVAIWRWVSVMEDNGVYRMWYDAYSEDPAGVFRWIPRLCYAESRDGVNWERPNLGVIEFEGSKNNNIVFEGIGNKQPVWSYTKLANGTMTYKPNFGANGAVFKDPIAPAQQKYRYTFNDNHSPSYEVSSGGGRIYGACSPDGIHWKVCKAGEPIIHWYHDGPPSCFWDDRIGKYVMYVRWDEGREFINGKWEYPPSFEAAEKSLISSKDHEFVPAPLSPGLHCRAIGRTEGNDFENFPSPEKILSADEHDDMNLGLYHSAAVKYPYAENAYFLFPGAFYGEHRATPDTIDVQLATSRDGILFRRWRESFVRLGMNGAFDSKMIDMGVGMVRRGNELLMYYGGSKFCHGETNPSMNPGLGGIGMVRIRVDGFVSQDAPISGGILITKPVKFGSGSRLVVNMDGSVNGTLKVDLLDEFCHPIGGFSGFDSDVLYGNDINRLVTWKGSGDFAVLKGRPIRLRFSGKSVKLYAFQFIPE